MTEYSEERKLLEAKIEHFEGIIKSFNERNGDSEKWVKLVKRLGYGKADA